MSSPLSAALLLMATSLFTIALALQQPQQPLWQWNELESVVGKDYTAETEVQVYDATHAHFRDVAQEARYVLDDLFQVQPGQSLVDFGCGTGTLVMEAAKRGLSPVHGVDVSPTMLAMARTKMDSSSDNKIQFHHAGFLTYQQPDDKEQSKVDYVTTTFALHHLPDLWKQVALQRIFDMLKPSGKLHIRDVVLTTTLTTNDEKRSFGPPPPPPTTTAMINKFVQDQAKLGQDHNDHEFLKDDAECHFREEFSTYDWILEGMMERAGFVVRKKEVECDGVIATYLCEKKEKSKVV